MDVLKPARGMVAAVTVMAPAVAVPLVLVDAPAASASACYTTWLDCTNPDLSIWLNDTWKRCADDAKTLNVGTLSYVEWGTSFTGCYPAS